MCIHKYIHTHLYKCTQIYTLANTYTHTHKHTNTHTHIHTHTTHTQERPIIYERTRQRRQSVDTYGVATTYRLLKIIGLFCKRAL